MEVIDGTKAQKETRKFAVHCPRCKATVVAREHCCVEFDETDVDTEGEPYRFRVLFGTCTQCKTILVGETNQIEFEQITDVFDKWSEVARVYPCPPRVVSSHLIPEMVKTSLSEADRSLQAGANIAACAMLGRALEALCRDILDPDQESERPIMLGEGIKKLKEEGVIDHRLYDWSQQLHAFRNLTAHPEATSISRQDAEDLQAFVIAIVEYVYVLTKQYLDLKRRVAAREKRKKP